MVGIDLGAVAAVQVGRNGLAQRRQPAGRGVAVMAVAQRPDRGLDDMRGGFEIRLADAQIDHLAPLRREHPGARQHGEGRFGPEPRGAVGELQVCHGEVSSPCRRPARPASDPGLGQNTAWSPRSTLASPRTSRAWNSNSVSVPKDGVASAE